VTTSSFSTIFWLCQAFAFSELRIIGRAALKLHVHFQIAIIREVLLPNFHYENLSFRSFAANSHDQLSKVLAFQQADEGLRCELYAFDEILKEFNLALADPLPHLF